MKKFIFVNALIIIALTAHSQNNRTRIKIPDIPGYQTLKCDFHIHTVFSDGEVWPTARVEEAWAEGLDAIALTDHIEYTPYSQYLKIDHDAPFEIAKRTALEKGILLIQGTEITKKYPGHFNALFIEDATAIANDDYRTAIEEAVKQGAFIVLNHPREAVHGGSEWWHKELDDLYNDGLINGIEIFNWNDYYPKAFDWALANQLTIFSGSDVHKESSLYRDQLNMTHRPMTLVFVKEKSLEEIKKALFDKKTVGFFRNTIYGQQALIKELFLNSITIEKAHFIDSSGNMFVRISNTSDIPLRMTPLNKNLNISEISLKADGSLIVSIPIKEEEKEVSINFEVENYYVNSNEKLKINLVFRRN